jgi:regulator of sirC expression with transglutaminase-like and TPR domain
MKEAHRLLAIIYTSRGAKKQAASELESYLKLAPDAPDAEEAKVHDSTAKRSESVTLAFF